MRVPFKMLFLKIIKRVSERYETFIFEHRWISKELDSDLRPAFVFRLRKQVPDKTYRPKGFTRCHAGNLQWEDKVYGHPRFNRLLISVIMLSLFTYTSSKRSGSRCEEDVTWACITLRRAPVENRCMWSGEEGRADIYACIKTCQQSLTDPTVGVQDL